MQDQSKTLKSSQAILRKWLASCVRKGKLSRNTIAIGIVVLDALRQKCPLEKDEMTSRGREIKGSRSGLSKVLIKYGIPGFLKEVTTRQAPQDGQRLLEMLKYGRPLCSLGLEDRAAVLVGLISLMLQEADAWLTRQHLKVKCNRESAPSAWVREILEKAKGRSGGRVEQHLVGAKLSKAYPKEDIPAYPGAAGDAQTGRAGDFQIGTTVFHVTAVPSQSVLEKCETNVQAGLHPVLLVPSKAKATAEYLADSMGMASRVTIVAIEDFLAINILEMSEGQRQDFIGILNSIVAEYNRRVEQAETDDSLRIEIQ